MFIFAGLRSAPNLLLITGSSADAKLTKKLLRFFAVAGLGTNLFVLSSPRSSLYFENLLQDSKERF